MKIKITALKEGLNEIRFDHSGDSLDLDEIEEYSNSFVYPIKVQVEINMVGIQLFLRVIVDTTVRLMCNRCLEEFDQKLHDEFRLIYSTEEALVMGSERESDIRLLTSESGDIDITNDIKESLLLAIPMKIICSEDCKGLCPLCGTNLNKETCNCNSEHIDPRWEALKKLKID